MEMPQSVRLAYAIRERPALCGGEKKPLSRVRVKHRAWVLVFDSSMAKCAYSTVGVEDSPEMRQPPVHIEDLRSLMLGKIAKSCLVL